MEITVTITYSQIILIFILIFSGVIAGKAISKYFDRPPERRIFMNPQREDITDEKIKSEMKGFAKMYRKMPPEHRKLIAYVLELIKTDLHRQSRILAEERKAENGRF